MRRASQEASLVVDMGRIATAKSPGRLKQLDISTGLYVGKNQCAIATISSCFSSCKCRIENLIWPQMSFTTTAHKAWVTSYLKYYLITKYDLRKILCWPKMSIFDWETRRERKYMLFSFVHNRWLLWHCSINTEALQQWLQWLYFKYHSWVGPPSDGVEGCIYWLERGPVCRLNCNHSVYLLTWKAN